MIDRLLPTVAAVTERMPPGLRRAYGDPSNRLLDSSSVYRQMRVSIAEMGSALIDFSEPPDSPPEERLHRFARDVRPWSAPGLTLRRVGGAGDGAYAMADVTGATRAISLGVGHDVSWDVDVASRGVTVDMFDPTVPGPPVAVPGGRFHPIGLGAAGTKSELDLRPFDELLRLAGADGRDDVLLKIDIEGAEWDALCDVDFSPFQQVLIEMHDLDRLADEATSAAVLATVERLGSTHRAVHVHANNERPFHRFGRVWFPEVIEVSFVRQDRMQGAEPAAELAAGLDRPSNPAYPDYDLRGLLTIAVE